MVKLLNAIVTKGAVLCKYVLARNGLALMAKLGSVNCLHFVKVSFRVQVGVARRQTLIAHDCSSKGNVVDEKDSETTVK